MAQRKVTAAQIEVSTLESSLTQLTGLTGGISTPDFISFDTAAAATSAVGKLFWDDGTGTLKFGLKGGNVDVDVGQTLVELCFQNTGTTIAKGKVVYISGAQGNRIKVDLADNTSDTTSSKTLGMVAESFPDGTEKFVITQGIIKNVDTSAYTPGTILWLGTSGNVTSTKPVAPNHLVFVGVVVKQNASSGEIYVKVQNGYELDEIHDVKITTPITDNSVLMYDTTQAVWENIAPTTAFNTLSPLTTKGDILTNDGTNDARLAVGTNGYVLSADSAEPTGLKWIAAPTGTGTVTSVALSGGTTGLTVSGSPITTSGTITLGGTLGLANGGTGATTASTAFTALADGITGTYGWTANAGYQLFTNNSTFTGYLRTINPTMFPVRVATTANITRSGTQTIDGVALSVDDRVLVKNQSTASENGIYRVQSGSWLRANDMNLDIGTMDPGRTVLVTEGSTLANTLWAVTASTPTFGQVGGGGGSGTVTSVDVSGGTTGLTFSGGPITTSGTITMAGTLDETNGGTNQTTYATGDLLYASASNTLSKLTIGSAGQVLTVSSGVPTWAAAPSGSGTVTSVAVSSSDSTLGITGSPITTSGTIDLTLNTVPVSKGGTGATTLTSNNVILGNGTSAVQFVAPGTSGNVLTSNGTTWTSAAPSGGGSVFYKDPVRVATTANGTLSTAFANGQAIDGITLATGDRILIKNQTTAADNGIYTVNASGAPTRATDMNENSESQRGITVYVQFGTVNGGSRWQLVSSNATPIVIGTSTQVWGPMQNIMVYGQNATTAPRAVGVDSIAIGASSNAASTYDIAIGSAAEATGSFGIAIGRNAKATTGSTAIAIGSRTATLSGTQAVGLNSANMAGNHTININGGSANLSANDGTIFIGRMNTAPGANNGAWSIYLGFYNGYTLGAYSSSIGYDNYPTSTGSVSLGAYARPYSNGELAFASGGFAAYGDAQSSNIVGRIQTTSATVTEIAVGNAALSTAPTSRITLTADASYIFDCDIIARNTATDTESKAWNLKFAIRRGATASTTTLIGTATKTVIGEDTGTSTWDVAVSADTTNGRPKIDVTGEAAKTIRWVANIRMTTVIG